MKVRLLLIVALLLSGCAAAPPEIPLSAIDRNAAERHQQAIASLTDWSISGQLALFNRVEDDRDAVYLEWQHASGEMRLRFYHPLKGTLARLEEDLTGATFFDEEGQPYYGVTAEQLIARIFNFQLPLQLLSEVITGRRPDGAVQLSYQLHDLDGKPYATLNRYLVATTSEKWQVELSNYQAEQSYLMPHQLELISPEWRIKLKVSQWKL
ncbi:outer membrane lipoprotein LolB [Pseudidiomarina sp. 1APP75-27a]|uniref:lipoprotein insertase outer membrane protein LolB n=1 Tax=Pseudidiomarina terrestris TaxID=2820060 RepID=UPI002B05B2D8|nr:lipoprotein insertase outer membrane protein LolB [Pseudidiomarina sp. 1APP75-27a]MEA3587385.1 outer membrane lipoprotein LolB [Pseudidiomarina sp. 1APP75-27a]